MKVVLKIKDTRVAAPHKCGVNISLTFTPAVKPSSKATLALSLSKVAIEAVANELARMKKEDSE